MKRGFEQFRVRKAWCEVNEMEAKGEKGQYRQPTQLNKDSTNNSAVLQLLLYT